MNRTRIDYTRIRMIRSHVFLLFSSSVQRMLVTACCLFAFALLSQAQDLKVKKVCYKDCVMEFSNSSYSSCNMTGNETLQKKWDAALSKIHYNPREYVKPNPNEYSAGGGISENWNFWVKKGEMRSLADSICKGMTSSMRQRFANGLMMIPNVNSAGFVVRLYVSVLKSSTQMDASAYDDLYRLFQLATSYKFSSPPYRESSKTISSFLLPINSEEIKTGKVREKYE